MNKYILTTISLLISILVSAQVELIKECGIVYSDGAKGMMALDGKLFFGSDDSATGLEPWISDGTPGGTHILKDIYPGTFSGLYAEKNAGKHYATATYNHAFYFIGYDAQHGGEIWKYDIANDTTYMLKDINPTGNVTGSTGNDLPYFTELNGYLYFAADDGNASGAELWRTDGTDTGTHLVKDIYPGNLPSNPAYLTKMGNAIYFRAWGENTGEEVWKTDGSANGTVLVKDVRPGPFSCFYSNSSWRNPNFQASGNYVYFVANIDSPETHYHYWRTDGTPDGTIQLENTLTVDPSNETEYTDVNGTFYFTASDGNPDHSNLFKSDGTSNGTVNVPTNNSLTSNGSFFAFKDQLYFNGVDNVSTYEFRFGLCKSDGTTQGSSVVKSFPGLNSVPDVRGLSTDGNLLYGGVLEKINDNEMNTRILQSDGTPAGTIDIPHYGIVSSLTYFNGKMYFAGFDSVIDASYYKPGLYAFTAVTVGVDEVSNTNDISVYPNPANKQLMVRTDGFRKAEVTITDMAGRTLVEKNATTSSQILSVDVSSFATGCYLLNLRSEGKTAVKKFIKE